MTVPLTDEAGRPLPTAGLTVKLRIFRSIIFEQTGTVDPATSVASFLLTSGGALAERNKTGWVAEVVADYPNGSPHVGSPTDQFQFIVD